MMYILINQGVLQHAAVEGHLLVAHHPGINLYGCRDRDDALKAFRIVKTTQVEGDDWHLFEVEHIPQKTEDGVHQLHEAGAAQELFLWEEANDGSADGVDDQQ